MILWIVAFFMTTGSAVFQRITGPTYPVFGSTAYGGREVHYRFDRSHGGESDAPVEVTAEDSSVTGTLEWKADGSAGMWSPVLMQRDGDLLRADLPLQPAATSVRYRVTLAGKTERVMLPGPEGIALRFKHDVPPLLLVAHIILMFSAMLLSTRAGLECFNKVPSLHVLPLATAIGLVLGGIVVGALVQKYAFDVYWTGWPAGGDVTDNKTAIATLAWVFASLVGRRSGNRKAWVLGASLVTLLMFLIPHSVLS